MPSRRRNLRLWLTVAFGLLILLNAGLYFMRCQNSSSEASLLCSLFVPPNTLVAVAASPQTPANTTQPSLGHIIRDASPVLPEHATAVVIAEFEEWSHQLEQTCSSWLKLPTVVKVRATVRAIQAPSHRSSPLS